MNYALTSYFIHIALLTCETTIVAYPICPNITSILIYIEFVKTLIFLFKFL